MIASTGKVSEPTAMVFHLTHSLPSEGRFADFKTRDERWRVIEGAWLFGESWAAMKVLQKDTDGVQYVPVALIWTTCLHECIDWTRSGEFNWATLYDECRIKPLHRYAKRSTQTGDLILMYGVFYIIGIADRIRFLTRAEDIGRLHF